MSTHRIATAARATILAVATCAAALGAAPVIGQAANDPTAGPTASAPGPLTGNQVQVPMHVPVNVCGPTVDPSGLLNPASGDTCATPGH